MSSAVPTVVLPKAKRLTKVVISEETKTRVLGAPLPKAKRLTKVVISEEPRRTPKFIPWSKRASRLPEEPEYLHYTITHPNGVKTAFHSLPEHVEHNRRFFKSIGCEMTIDDGLDEITDADLEALGLGFLRQ